MTIKTFVQLIEDDRYYVRSMFVFFTLMSYSLLLFEYLLELGLISFGLGGVISIALMAFYAYQHVPMLTSLDNSLFDFSVAAHNKDKKIAVYNYLLAMIPALLISISSVFEFTHALIPFIASSYINLFYVCRAMMVLSYFRYMVQINLKHVSYIKFSAYISDFKCRLKSNSWADYITKFVASIEPALGAFSPFQWSVMSLIVLLGEHAPQYYYMYPLIAFLSIRQYAKVHEISMFRLEVLIALELVCAVMCLSSLSWLSCILALNLSMLCMNYFRHGGSVGSFNDVMRLSKYCIVYIRSSLISSSERIAMFIHSAVEALYPTLGLNQMIHMSSTSFFTAFFVFYISKSMSMSQNPFSIWQDHNVRSHVMQQHKQLSYLYALCVPFVAIALMFVDFPSAVLGVSIVYAVNDWLTMDRINAVFKLCSKDVSKNITAILHGLSDVHEFVHAQSSPCHMSNSHGAHHHASVSLSSKVIVFASCLMASLNNLCYCCFPGKKDHIPIGGKKAYRKMLQSNDISSIPLGPISSTEVALSVDDINSTKFDFGEIKYCMEC